MHYSKSRSQAYRVDADPVYARIIWGLAAGASIAFAIIAVYVVGGWLAR
jgi:phage shock protein PspC (stress-responsive transcriptional regulator)